MRQKGKYILFAAILFVTGCINKSKSFNVVENHNINSSYIMVYAAASLTDVLTEIADSFEVKYQIKVKLNKASSGTLARQIEQEGNADVYISASKRWVDYVDSLGFIQRGMKSKVAMNELVLVVPGDIDVKATTVDRKLELTSLIGTGRLSIGDPSHVPAGKYAKQGLEYFGWYKPLEVKILPAKDVRSALMVVEMGEVPVGIVYKTDAIRSDKVKIYGTFPAESHDSIVYVAGVCSKKEMAELFYEYLKDEKVKTIWMKYGFKV